MLIKFICTSKINSNHSIKRREKTDIEIKNVKYPKAFFVVIHKQLTMSMKILKTIIQQIKEKC